MSQAKSTGPLLQGHSLNFAWPGIHLIHKVSGGLSEKGRFSLLQQQKINIKKDLVVFLVKRNIVKFCSEEKPTRTVLLPECCTIAILW